MNFVTFVVLVVPAMIGMVSAAILGPNRGTIVGAVIMIVAVLLLLTFFVSTSIGHAAGLMRFEWPRWLPSFLFGAAIGSVIYRVRRRERIFAVRRREPGTKSG
jgi:peptidoglycan/LPS O-acetylase OafA/YrhL